MLRPLGERDLNLSLLCGDLDTDLDLSAGDFDLDLSDECVDLEREWSSDDLEDLRSRFGVLLRDFLPILWSDVSVLEEAFRVEPSADVADISFPLRSQLLTKSGTTSVDGTRALGLPDGDRL